ncbi:MAG TPA: hypothetical protein DIT59_00600 [Leclercia sp.]|nr:hypothetical protein [Leclercia sp.]
MKNLILVLAALASFSAMADCESGHWINDVMDNGGLIKLEDNSIWQVDPVDTADSMIWLMADNVVICSNGKMINTSESTGNTVHVRLLTRE